MWKCHRDSYTTTAISGGAQWWGYPHAPLISCCCGCGHLAQMRATPRLVLFMPRRDLGAGWPQDCCSKITLWSESKSNMKCVVWWKRLLRKSPTNGRRGALWAGKQLLQQFSTALALAGGQGTWRYAQPPSMCLFSERASPDTASLDVPTLKP